MVEMLPLVRVVLLVAAILQFLLGAVFPFVRDRIAGPIRRRAEAQGRPIPAAVDKVLFSRGLTLIMSLAPLSLWWFLGTASGQAFWHEAFRER
jgi:hypothetical protein